MPRSYIPPHYSTVGIQLMGRMFEQQVRVAQVLSVAAIASNPLLSRPIPRSMVRPDEPAQRDTRPTRAKLTVLDPPAKPAKTVPRTHAMPV